MDDLGVTPISGNLHVCVCVCMHAMYVLCVPGLMGISTLAMDLPCSKLSEAAWRPTFCGAKTVIDGILIVIAIVINIIGIILLIIEIIIGIYTNNS